MSQEPSSFTELGGHLALSAYLPSGAADVCLARNRLYELMIDAGTLPLREFGESDFVPLVYHMTSGTHLYRPDALFVGKPTMASDISPWSQPLPSCEFSVNVNFLSSRRDLRALLWPLRDKILYCDCSNRWEECWASL